MHKFYLENLDCANCATEIEKAIQLTPGVGFARINLALQSLQIDVDDIERIKKIIKQIDPNIEVIESRQNLAETESGIDWGKILPLLSATSLYILGLLLIYWLRFIPLGIGEILIFGLAYGISGFPVLRNAARNIIHGRVFDENFLMSIATIGAIIIGEIPEAAAVMIFYMVGEYLQSQSLNRSRQSIRALIQSRPNRANIIRNQQIIVQHPRSVKVGEKFLVRPGEKIPVDGKIYSGSSYVNTSPLTGETRPKSVRPGDLAYAGTINLDGLLKLIAVRPYDNSTIAKIVELTENAVGRKAQTERFITRFAQIYSPLVVFGALVVAAIPPLFFGGDWLEWLYRALVVLVISCPCALVISIPLGYFGGIGGASKRGILVKGSNYLDVLASIKTLVFDKTGTLTKGVFRVTGIYPHNGFRQSDLLSFAAQAEAGSSHPIAKSIRDACQEKNEYQNHQSVEISGQGVKAWIKGKRILVGNDLLLHNENIEHDRAFCNVKGTIVHVAVDGTYAGHITISDQVKEGIFDTIQILREEGVTRIVMLTGDKRDTAAEIAADLELDGYKAELLPEGKIEALETIIEQNKKTGKVGFVGDGINDAPALTRADVGIAMGALGSEAAIEAADVVIMTDSPTKISEAVQIAKKTRSIVWQNIGFALVTKAIFIALGISGNASMWQAVFGDMGVAIVAIFNATRVLSFNRFLPDSKV